MSFRNFYPPYTIVREYDIQRMNWIIHLYAFGVLTDSGPSNPVILKTYEDTEAGLNRAKTDVENLLQGTEVLATSEEKA